MEPEGLFFLWRMGSEARGTKPQYRFPRGAGVVGKFLQCFGGNWVAKKNNWGALRDWGFDEGFLCYDDKMIAC